MRQAILATAMSMSIAGIAAPWDARAAEPDYLDDRSDAEAVVKSFYNAINRREFSRAWSYFGETKPSANFESFVAGFEGTKSVRVVTGEPGVEGAAGSTFFNVPVAIAATGVDDTERVFAGCYTARLVNPQIQEPPFTGLHLERGALKPSDQSAEEALPAQCGDGPPPPARDAELEQAKKAFAASHGEECAPRGQDAQPTEPERYIIKFHNTVSTDDGEQEVQLFRFFCTMGAYNEAHYYYRADKVRGVREIHFATPELQIQYQNGDSEGKVEAVNIIGYRSDGELINSFYDEATKTITSHAKWRGVGDASSTGIWLFRDGEFSLVQYDVDATYDGEINPETVLDYNTAP
ncbi:DUF1176 domain-containing protein [Allomesorhizobium camelthorni]|uniref:DUF1176 domain-containing protein n=1 Tax=Allomesorhizobium camelthorni TaxID=475069 RepID=A0A6G4W9Z3_9HYPH|nr:DUF1176 domain-containing protein [Mesorhizobium camelthorni]NGO51033.1 DUF1176 domain-containing protein [Mesorhizobium camelthorni]